MNKHNRSIKNRTSFLFIVLIIISINLFTVLFVELEYRQAFVAEHFQRVGAIIWILTFFKILISPQILYGYEPHNKINDDKTFNMASFYPDWDILGR